MKQISQKIKDNQYQKFLAYILNSNKLLRKSILVLFDCASIIISLFISNLLIFDSIQLINKNLNLTIFFNAFLIALTLYSITGQYKPLTRFIDFISYKLIIYRNLFIVPILFSFLYLSNELRINYKFWVVFTIILIAIQIGYRFLIKHLLDKSLYYKSNSNNDKVCIYGANYDGFQVSNLIQREGWFDIVSFIDDNISLKGSSINNIPINSLKDFDRRNLKIKNLILTSSLDSSKKFTKIKNFCDKKGIKIIGIGPERELIKIKNDNKFYSVDSNNLIDRKKLKSNKLLLKAGVNKELSICVTGAGGSIGSELSRQILLLEPKKLILVDFCEFNLFKISEELKELSSENIIIKLLNTENEYDLEKIFSDYSVDVVFHAAAYKHVPIVESNNISGIKNNIISTKSVCSAAIKSGVRKMILISSDKAVRPTNIMGATKLISEFIVNEYSKLSKTKTIFSTVRFGNVINSSGSVIPIFREQIKNGGPITITHEKMERYFMTISEAVQLVLQASAIMKGGETFILDMGESIKIIEIAKKMILNSGFKLKDQNSGDIEIKFTGIRPGEKLKEELTINGNLIDTIHPLIKLANEDVQTPENLIEEVNKMIKNIKNYKYDEAIQIFNNLYKIKD